jgi:signal transduction histidine kinase
MPEPRASEDRLPESAPGREHEQALRFMPSEEHGRTEILYPAFSAAWKLPDGSYRVVSPPKTWIEPWQERLLIGFGLTILLILPLAWLLSQRLSKPIVAFSEAAAKVGFEDHSPPVLSAGPREVRAAANVLNAMQARLKKQVESRTALMGAIAHDLKTPLARMRLRIEDLPEATRDKLAGDIAHMDGLIRSAMSFTTAHTLRDHVRPLDLSALIETLADDLAMTCEMEPPLIEAHVKVNGDTVALKRIVTNLVENACRYAGSCRIELSTRGKDAEIAVIDPGPGLPPDMLEMVFEPFYRMESSRNRDTGGSGLGLSVARALAEAQGGTLKLINRYEGQAIVGLEARLSMPRLFK